MAPDCGKMHEKRVRLFLEIKFLITGATASEHYVVQYVKIYVVRGPGRGVISLVSKSGLLEFSKNLGTTSKF